MYIKNSHIVTGGKAYSDIDVLACASAYRQLLELLETPAQAIISPIWNQTIPSSIHSWPIFVDRDSKKKFENCHFSIVDVSDPRFFLDSISLADVYEVFDHHHGYEEYWKNRIGNRSYIEKVGACATLIWERFKALEMEKKISSTNANLLYTAIFANTLNFKSYSTHERDLKAFEELLLYTQLPSDWKERYYHEIQKEILDDILKSIAADTKIFPFLGKHLFFGQLELWNAREIASYQMYNFLSNFLSNQLPEQDPYYILNVVSIEEEKNYLISNIAILKECFQESFKGVQLTSGWMTTERLWQRKELLKEMNKLFEF